MFHGPMYSPFVNEECPSEPLFKYLFHFNIKLEFSTHPKVIRPYVLSVWFGTYLIMSHLRSLFTFLIYHRPHRLSTLRTPPSL